MSLLQITNLTFGYEGSFDNVFENVSVSLDSDWRLGLTGRNGRGKTTLLRLLMGEYPYTGRIEASQPFNYFPYPVTSPERPAGEIAAELAPEAADWQIRREFGRLGLDEGVLWQPFCTLSNGEQTKALLAALFLRQDRFLLIDEPTNHLDAAGRALVAAYLRGKQGFLLVSHDRAFLDGCVDHMMAIEKTGITVRQGNFTSWWENEQRRTASEQAQNERLKKEIGRLHEAAGRASRWSDKAEKAKFATRNSGLRADRGYVGHKAAKMMARAKAIEARKEAAAEEKSGLLKNVEHAPALALSAMPARQNRLVELRALRIYYGDTCACGPVDLLVRPGERVALCGGNGCGKSTLLHLIEGQNLRYTGELWRAGGLVLSRVAQNAEGLQGSVIGYARACGVDETQFLTILRKFDFRRAQFEKDMASFSAGQKKKVLLARSLCERAQLYIWDEPLNYIDVFSRMQIEALILQYQPTLLFVEHDRTFCEHIATRSLALD